MKCDQFLPALAIGLALLVTSLWAVDPTPPVGDTAAATSPAPVEQLLREGQTVEISGKLELAGDRAILYPENGGPALRVLENLALERVTRILSESRGQREWLVTGTITEYRGSNYLLISRAVQRATKTKTTKTP